MFGMTAVTAWELEAERRVELAHGVRPARRSKTLGGRENGLLSWLRRFTGSLSPTPWPGLKDVRT